MAIGTVAIVGAQWGSEGKGVVAAALAPLFDVAVRVGGPNAGHSFRRLNGDGGYRTYKMRGVPCAWVNPDCRLYIGAGAVIDPELLARELNDLPNVDVILDGAATVVTPQDMEEEHRAGLGDAVGSTLEGVGAARAAKIRRAGKVLARQYTEWHDRVHVTGAGETVWYLNQARRAGDAIMLEGTQGSGLSLHHGEWPYVTSADTNVGGLLADTGLPHADHVFLVARTLPIRVGGNSGPMGEELSWEKDLPWITAERTTVTNKIRRIARWNPWVFGRAVDINAPCGVFLTFADYLVPEMAGETNASSLLEFSQPGPLGDLQALTARIEDIDGVPVVAYGTGGPGWALAWRGRCAHGVEWDPKA